MATNPFKRVSVPTAVDASNHFDLSYNHMTTLDYFQPCVAMFHESVPGESFKMEQKVFTRLAPLLKPMIADVKIKTSTFFVPYRTVFGAWNDFIADVPTMQGSTIAFRNPHTINEATIRNFLLKFSTPGTANNYDYYNPYSSPSPSPMLLTYVGRKYYSILLGLGYNISLDTQSNQLLSAMPLLAYFKVCQDWLRNNAFIQDEYFEFDNLCKQTTPVHLTALHLEKFFQFLGYFTYEKDYFTSATVYPNGSNNIEMSSAINLPDPNNGDLAADLASGQSAGEYASITSNYDTNDVLTKYTLDGVLALTDLAKRHQLSGIQPFLRVLTEYGVALPDAVVNRSVFIGSDEIRVDIGDVTSTNETDQMFLGDQAGRGIAFGNKSYSYKTDEFGAFITIAFVVPAISYVDGMKKHVMRHERTDYYVPELEQLGYEPISSKELHRDANGGTIWGFTPRYAAYKCNTDIMSGLPFFHSTRDFYEGWFNYRKIERSDADHIDWPFTTAWPSDVPSNFATKDNTSGSFVVIFRNNISAQLPMHRLYDEYKFSNYDEHPRQVNIPNQGLTMH